ncbi:hypothetical protein MMC16_005475 [Acarospora aff. strigata]|nr:hypothetical protein [Acarospora aff. strigata]
MGLAGAFFSFWRLLQILTLIPTLGMLAYFVNGFVSSNQLTPNYILILFITSVLAAAWAIATLFRRRSTRESAIFVSFIDFCFIGAFIASVVELRGIGNASCTNFTAGPIYLSLGPFGYFGQTSNSPFAVDVNKTCAMLKASFAFGIMNCIFFAITSFLLLFMKGKDRDDRKERVVHRHSHDSRRGHSRSGHSRHNSRRRYYV